MSEIINFIKYKIKRIVFNKKFGAYVSSFDVHKNTILGKATSIGQRVRLAENVSIGKYSYVNNNSIIEQSSIGNYCSIGPNVVIGLGRHDYEQFSTHPFLYSQYWQKEIEVSLDNPIAYKDDEITVIGNDVWIGANVVIKKGVNIGDGAVIGAGAVVIKDIDAYTIVGGVPAKKIKDRFSSEVANKLIETNWWNLDSEELNEKIPFLIKIVDS